MSVVLRRTTVGGAGGENQTVDLIFLPVLILRGPDSEDCFRAPFIKKL